MTLPPAMEVQETAQETPTRTRSKGAGYSTLYQWSSAGMRMHAQAGQDAKAWQSSLASIFIFHT
jgi:hypothetical protein